MRSYRVTKIEKDGTTTYPRYPKYRTMSIDQESLLEVFRKPKEEKKVSDWPETKGWVMALLVVAISAIIIVGIIQLKGYYTAKAAFEGGYTQTTLPGKVGVFWVQTDCPFCNAVIYPDKANR